MIYVGETAARRGVYLWTESGRVPRRRPSGVRPEALPNGTVRKEEVWGVFFFFLKLILGLSLWKPMRTVGAAGMSQNTVRKENAHSHCMENQDCCSFNKGQG